MRFLRLIKGLFYSFIVFILLYVLVGFIPLQLLKENQDIVLGVLAVIALAVGYGFLSTFDKWIEQAFQRAASFSFQQFQYIGVGIILANIVGVPILIPLMYAGEHALGVAILVVFDVLAIWGAIFIYRVRERREGITTDQPEFVLDTSVLVDGRILDIMNLDLLKGRVVVPSFVVDEIRQLADSTDPVKRDKGQRALKVLEQLKASSKRLSLVDHTPRGVKGVDDALIQYARDRKATIVTLDSNLAKIARLHNTDVINFSEVFLALRPNINVGDELTIKIVKEGKIRQQGVGFLDDGTMIVVEDAADLIGNTVRVVVTNVHVSDTGKIIFTKVAD
ncbi:MAG TPA: PIN/TRAM domain-containing protein [Coprothermobacter sp.]|nr:PIN/TRAM domain-containing protein [Coprothermobacter sp.]